MRGLIKLTYDGAEDEVSLGIERELKDKMSEEDLQRVEALMGLVIKTVIKYVKHPDKLSSRRW